MAGTLHSSPVETMAGLLVVLAEVREGFVEVGF